MIAYLFTEKKESTFILNEFFEFYKEVGEIWLWKI